MPSQPRSCPPASGATPSAADFMLANSQNRRPSGGSPALQTSPAAQSSLITDAKHLLAPSGEGYVRQEAGGKSPRTIANNGQEGFQVRKAWDGMRAPWDGMRHCRPAVVGLCCTQETTPGAVLVPQYTDCSEKPTVKALASNPCSFTSARTSRLPIVGDTQTICNGSAESRGLAWAPRIASGHVA